MRFSCYDAATLFEWGRDCIMPSPGRLAYALAALLLASPACSVAQGRGFANDESASSPSADTGKNYALVIGIDDYQNLRKLTTAAHDADAVAALLQSQYGFTAAELRNGEATRDNILRAFADLRRTLTESDSLLIYYAGHGHFDRETSKAYWLLVDADADPDDTARDISADDITTWVRGLHARHVLIVSDSCYSGDLGRGDDSISTSGGEVEFIRRMQSDPSRTLLASGGDEPVPDQGPDGHSIFATILLHALAERKEAVFTAADLFSSIRRPIIGRSTQTPHYLALPNAIAGSASLDDGDFVFSRKTSAPLATAPLTALDLPAPKPPSPQANEEFERGRQLVDAGKMQDAARTFDSACQLGSAQACGVFGVMLESGQGTAADIGRAAQVYRKGCDGGFAMACTNLGVLYIDGHGVPQNDATAAQLYSKGCDGGSTFGCDNLGHMYSNGQGIEPDPARAAELYGRACDAGDATGCNDLAVAYDTGRGADRDPRRAAELYRKACDGGDMLGCSNLGVLYENGRGVAEDFPAAISLFRKGCDAGEPMACYNLGEDYEKGSGLPKDLSQATALYQKACDAGEPHSCDSLKRLAK